MTDKQEPKKELTPEQRKVLRAIEDVREALLLAVADAMGKGSNNG